MRGPLLLQSLCALITMKPLRNAVNSMVDSTLRLEEDGDVSGSSGQDADNYSLRRAFQGLATNIAWKPE